MYHVNVTQTVTDISPLMPMHQDPLLVLLVSLQILFIQPLMEHHLSSMTASSGLSGEVSFTVYEQIQSIDQG